MKPYMNPTPHLSCHREPRGERDPPLPSSPTGESSDVLPAICPTTRLTFFPPILLQSLPPSSSSTTSSSSPPSHPPFLVVIPSDGLFLANISYDDDTAGDELTQLINVIFGNTSIYPGVQVTDVELSSRLHSLYPGPKFGIDGLRELCGAPNNAPLVMTALKPMGTSAADLAHMAYRLAVGGCDIIKDDHGLANQKYAPYEERVKLCSAAVDLLAGTTTRRQCRVLGLQHL